MKRYFVLFALLIVAVPASAVAEVVVQGSGEFGPKPSSEARQLAFEIRDTNAEPMLEATVTLTQGKAQVRVTDPAGVTIFEAGTGARMQLSRQPLKIAGSTGTFHVTMVPENALGTWTVRVVTKTELRQIWLYVVPGAGMVVVGIGAVLLWRMRSGAKWRWFWVGAAVWTVGVVLKFAFAIALNRPVLAGLKDVLPETAYLAVGSIYVGLLTGIFEVGITLVAALIWRQMAQDAARGVAVGVGAGAFEAILLGLGTAIAVVAALAVGGQAEDELTTALASTARTTPLLWLVAPVERVIAILCHTSSRALVLLGVARKSWFWPFTWGFLIMTAIDSIAGYVHLSEQVGKMNTWWIELAIAPAALVSIPILAWCVRNWPAFERTAPDEIQLTET
jgi:uncharacterized membrane protein YhfC